MIETRRTIFTQLELAASGIVDRQDVRRAAEALGSALDGDGQARLLIDLRAVEDITMKAFAADAGVGTRIVPKLKRLQRVAVVGDASWLRSLERVRGALLPRLQVRTFSADGIEEARAWLGSGGKGGADPETGSPESLSPPAPEPTSDRTSGADGEADGSAGKRAGRFDARSVEGLIGAAFEAFTGQRREDRPDASTRSGAGSGSRDVDDAPGLHVDADVPGVLALRLDGRIRAGDIEAAAALLDAPSDGDVRLLARLVRFEGIEPAALVSPALWRLQREGLSRVSRAAIVTSVDWLARMIESAARLQRVEVRTFGPDEEDAARTWLDAPTSV